MSIEEGDFITELAREVLRGAELDDLQTLFALSGLSAREGFIRNLSSEGVPQSDP